MSKINIHKTVLIALRNYLFLEDKFVFKLIHIVILKCNSIENTELYLFVGINVCRKPTC